MGTINSQRYSILCPRVRAILVMLHIGENWTCYTGTILYKLWHRCLFAAQCRAQPPGPRHPFGDSKQQRTCNMDHPTTTGNCLCFRYATFPLRQSRLLHQGWAMDLFRKTGQSPISLKRAHDVTITSLLRQNDVATPFWRNNDVIIKSCGR